jgi:hypothetical protein
MQENTDLRYQTLPVQHYHVPIAVPIQRTVPVLLSKNRHKNKFIKRSRLTSFRRHIYVPDPLLFMFISRLFFILHSKLTGVMTAKKMEEYELPHTHPSIFPLSLGTSVRSVICQHDEERSSVQLFQDRIPTKSVMNKRPEILISK